MIVLSMPSANSPSKTTLLTYVNVCTCSHSQLAKHVTYTLYVNATQPTEISIKIAESCSDMTMKGVGGACEFFGVIWLRIVA
jgi:hypothetical protein